jgi:hypothetical protein
MLDEVVTEVILPARRESSTVRKGSLLLRMVRTYKCGLSVYAQDGWVQECM